MPVKNTGLLSILTRGHYRSFPNQELPNRTIYSRTKPNRTLFSRTELYLAEPSRTELL